MSKSKDPIWLLIILGCILAALVGRLEAKGVHEEDNDKAVDENHSGELGESRKVRRSTEEQGAGNLKRLFKRATGDGDGGDADDKPHKSKKKKKNHTSTTTTSTPSTSSKVATAGSTTTTTSKPSGSTTKAPSGGTESTTTTTGKPGSTTAAAGDGSTTTTTTTTTKAPGTTMSPKHRDNVDMIKSQEDEANIITNIENSLTQWDKWLNDNKLTLNRHFALEVYHHFRRIMLTQGLEYQKHRKSIMVAGPPPMFIQDGDHIIQANRPGEPHYINPERASVENSRNVFIRE